MRHLIAALVINEPGVLAKVAGMFAARGFNIDSLVVGRTKDPDISRMTIVVIGDDQMLDQVRKQLGKLVEVVKVSDYADIEFVERDLMLMRVAVSTENRSEVIEMAHLFRARIVDVGIDQLMVLMTGTEEKIEAFIDLMDPYGIVELARTGVIALPRGSKVIDLAQQGKNGLRKSHRKKARGDRGNVPTSNIDPTKLPPG